MFAFCLLTHEQEKGAWTRGDQDPLAGAEPRAELSVTGGKTDRHRDSQVKERDQHAAHTATGAGLGPPASRRPAVARHTALLGEAAEGGCRGNTLSPDVRNENFFLCSHKTRWAEEHFRQIN